MSLQTQDYDENQQTIEFVTIFLSQYKIQLMEKEREISDHATKLKKIEFKNNRDLKQLKMAEEKAKNQLKQQKAKLDKMAKTSSEATQQNNILQHRLTELKQQKQKQIESVRAQYNHLKTQVRSYERILPTHTFMNKLGASYQQLPTYEQVFMNWKDKSEKCDCLEEKIKNLKIEMDEKVQTQSKAMESLQKKKLDIQKQLRDDVSKILQLETHVTTLTIERDQFRQKLTEVAYDLSSSMATNQQLTEENKALQAKLEEVVRVFHGQIQAKQEQIHQVVQEQARKFEQELDKMTREFESKQNGHLQQLAYFEQQEHRLHEKMQKEKQKMEENSNQLYLQVQKIKAELEVQKYQNSKHKSECESLKLNLHQKTAQALSHLDKLNENEIKIDEMANQIKRYAQKVQNQQGETEQKIETTLRQKQEMEQRVNDLICEVTQLRQQLLVKQNEIEILNAENEQMRNKKRDSFGNSSFPSFEEQIDHRNRLGTEDQIIEIQKIPIGLVINIPNNEEQCVRSRQSSIVSQKTERRKVSTMFYTQQQVDQKISEIRKQKQEQFSKKVNCVRSQMQEISNGKLRIEIERIENEKNKELNDRKRQLDDIAFEYKKVSEELQQSKSEVTELRNKANKKYDLLRMQKDNLQQSVSKYVTDLKKQKQLLQQSKITNKQLQNNINDTQRIVQQQNIQIQSFKKYKQKVDAKQIKQKSNSTEPSSANMKEIIDKYTQQLNSALKDKQTLILKVQEQQQQIKNLQKQLGIKDQQILDINSQIDEKNKQNDMLQDLLDHERKDRTLRTVPSLAALVPEDEQQQENFKQFYNQAGQKEGQIIMLEREVDDLKVEIEDIKQKNQQKINSLEDEMKEYIQQIIQMKFKVANSQMKANEKVHLYNQLKKKLKIQ